MAISMAIPMAVPMLMARLKPSVVADSGSTDAAKKSIRFNLRATAHGAPLATVLPY